METMEYRLRVLEQDLRRSQRINRTFAFALLAIVFLTGAQSKTPESSKSSASKEAQPASRRQSETGSSVERDRLRTVEANQFVLVDQLGRTRMQMAITNGGPTISMFDDEGNKGVELAQTNTSARISLMASDGSPAVTLQLPGDAESAHLAIRGPQGSSFVKTNGFSVLDSENQGRLHLALLNGNLPTLGISQRGQSGPPSIEMTANDGMRSVKIHDQNGAPLFLVHTDRDSTTSVNLRHPDHARSLEISTGASGEAGPAMAFLGPVEEDGTGGILPLLGFGLHRDRQPYFRILAPDGRPRFSAPSE